MSLKNRDEHNRWRSKTVAFRVSPEEDAQIERYVRLSGLTKQDYITRRLTHKDVVVQGNPRVFKALQFQKHFGKLIPQRLENSGIALHYHILVGEPPGDVVLLGQPGELHIAFELSILLRRYPEGNRLIAPAIMLVSVL